MPEFDLQLVLLACLGGALPDLLRIARNRYASGIAKYLKTLNFWTGLVVLMLIGGLVAWVFDASNAKDALILGFSAPAIISQLIGAYNTKRERTALGATAPQSSTIANWWGR